MLFFWLLVYRFLFLVVFAQNFFFRHTENSFDDDDDWVYIVVIIIIDIDVCLMMGETDQKNEFWKIFTIFFWTQNLKIEEFSIFFFCFACHQCFWMVIFRRRCFIVSRPFTPNHHHHIIHMMMIIASITTKKHHSQNGKNKIQKTYQAYRQPEREREKDLDQKTTTTTKSGTKKKPRKFFGNKKISRMFRLKKLFFFRIKNIKFYSKQTRKNYGKYTRMKTVFVGWLCVCVFDGKWNCWLLLLVDWKLVFSFFPCK